MLCRADVCVNYSSPMTSAFTFISKHWLTTGLKLVKMTYNLNAAVMLATLLASTGRMTLCICGFLINSLYTLITLWDARFISESKYTVFVISFGCSLLQETMDKQLYCVFIEIAKIDKPFYYVSTNFFGIKIENIIHVVKLTGKLKGNMWPLITPLNLNLTMKLTNHGVPLALIEKNPVVPTISQLLC